MKRLASLQMKCPIFTLTFTLSSATLKVITFVISVTSSGVSSCGDFFALKANSCIIAALNYNTFSDLLNNDPVFSKWSAQEQQQARSAVLSNLMNYNLDHSTLTPDQRDLHNALRREYRTRLEGDDNENASDVYGGVINNAIVGEYGHHGTNTDGSTYWLNSDNTVRRTTEKESFAEYYGRYMVADPERSAGLASTGSNLPESQSCIEEMLDSMR